ncbi:hypothetical protein RIF29_20408 [Crotalaria pallida]|uniref:Uncharacterized protein n=1 Tax=Crotalaria pallida TaxID=3830 RepID=A0AAN9I7G2_CROPI
MAKKRGRPTNTTPSTTTHDSAQKQSISDSVPLDLETLDDLDIDSLMPKQTEKVLTALDEIRLRIFEKAGSGSGSNKEDEGNKEKQTPVRESTPSQKPDQPNSENENPWTKKLTE